MGDFYGTSQAVAYPPGHMNGLVASYTSAIRMDLSAGTCRDSTDTINITWAGGNTDITKTGVGGRSTNLTEGADAWYRVLLISTAAGVVNMLIVDDTAVDTGDFPAGPGGTTYDYWRQVAWWRNDGSSDLVPFTSHGSGSERTFFWDVGSSDYAALFVLSAGTATTWTDVDCTAVVPPDSTLFFANCVNTNPDTGEWFHIRPNGSSANDYRRIYPSTGGDIASAHTWIGTDANQLIEYQYVGAPSAGGATIIVLGYKVVF